MKLIKPYSLSPSPQASEPTTTQFSSLEGGHLSYITLERSAHSYTRSQRWELVALREAASVLGACARSLCSEPLRHLLKWSESLSLPPLWKGLYCESVCY